MKGSGSFVLAAGRFPVVTLHVAWRSSRLKGTAKAGEAMKNNSGDVKAYFIVRSVYYTMSIEVDCTYS
jgi:hypothetical protein